MGGALRFLTVLPVPGRHAPPAAGTLVAFPLVGVVVGLAWLAPAAAAERFPTTAICAALILVVDAVLTGGLHLDALADVADGVGSRRRGAEAIAVMRDSAVGAVGALAVVLVCLVRYSALIGLIGFPLRQVVGPLIAAPVAGRLAMVLLLALVPPRPDGSLAAAVARPTGAVVAGAALLAVLAAGIPDRRGLAGLAVAGAVAFLFAAWWRRRFGDLTGDGVGAGGLLAETAALLTSAALMVA